MILVDTSILIQFLGGENDSGVATLVKLIEGNQPFGFSAYTFTEVLQGARDDEELRTLNRYLGSQVIYYPDAGLDTFKQAASIYYSLRKEGITLRGLVDILIALTAIHNNLLLLHNDRDFEFIQRVDSRLKTV